MLLIAEAKLDLLVFEANIENVSAKESELDIANSGRTPGSLGSDERALTTFSETGRRCDEKSPEGIVITFYCILPDM